MRLGVVENLIDVAHRGARVAAAFVVAPLAGVLRHDGVEVLIEPLLIIRLPRRAVAAQVVVDAVVALPGTAVPKLNACRFRLTSTGVPGATPDRPTVTSPWRKFWMYVSAAASAFALVLVLSTVAPVTREICEW